MATICDNPQTRRSREINFSHSTLRFSTVKIRKIRKTQAPISDYCPDAPDTPSREKSTRTWPNQKQLTASNPCVPRDHGSKQLLIIIN
ncbi:hypothetical protein J6590_005792 [Homalodisca vitripennis]|nr:hypothetical protein J6590_005792 [Homalodisca vitripennis]